MQSLTIPERRLKRPSDFALPMSASLPADIGHENPPLAKRACCFPPRCSFLEEELCEVIIDDDHDDCSLEANSKKELLISEMVRSLEEVIGINNNTGQPSSSSSSSCSSQLNSSYSTTGGELHAVYEYNRRGATRTFVPSCNHEQADSEESSSAQLNSSHEYQSTYHEQLDSDGHVDICSHEFHSDGTYHGHANAIIDHEEFRQLLAEADTDQEPFGTRNYNPCYTADFLSHPQMLFLDQMGIYSFDDPVTFDHYVLQKD